SLARATESALRSARARIAWCMVGTAVYQVGWASSSQAKNFSALKPGVANTLAPADRLDATAAIRPWMWNSGMMLRQRSSGVSAKVSRMLRAVAQMLRWLSGTVLGRDVVPEVCSTSAMSSVPAWPVALAWPVLGPLRVKAPAGAPSGTRKVTIGIDRARATSRAGEVEPS